MVWKPPGASFAAGGDGGAIPGPTGADLLWRALATRRSGLGILTGEETRPV